MIDSEVRKLSAFVSKKKNNCPENHWWDTQRESTMKNQFATLKDNKLASKFLTLVHFPSLRIATFNLPKA